MNQDIRRASQSLPEQHTTPKKQPVKNKSRRGLIASGIILSLAAGALAALFFTGKIGKSENLNDPLTVKSKVAKHFVLPADEEPALATITDKNKINTPFLKKAENGDKMLIYQEAKRIILYRPSLDRIIDVGPVSIATPGQ